MDPTVLDCTGQKGAGEGLLVTGDKVTLRDFALENPKDDGMKSKGAADIVHYRVRVRLRWKTSTTPGQARVTYEVRRCA